MHLRKYFLGLCIAGQCNTNINPKNYVTLESEKYSSQKREMGFIEFSLKILEIQFTKNRVYRIREIYVTEISLPASTTPT